MSIRRHWLVWDYEALASLDLEHAGYRVWWAGCEAIKLAEKESGSSWEEEGWGLLFLVDGVSVAPFVLGEDELRGGELRDMLSAHYYGGE